MEILYVILELLIHFAGGWQLGKWLAHIIIWIVLKIRGEN